MNITNKAVIAGEVISDFRSSHESYGEKFYMVDVAVKRDSGIRDVVPAMVSERLELPNEENMGNIHIAGEIRTYNSHKDGRNHLDVFVFANEIRKNDGRNINKVAFEGFICRKPIYRITPLGREIADLLVAVNRSYGKSDYIPCICWGRNARFSSGLEVGTHIRIEGRFQSREYKKKLAENEYEMRIAYEVSVTAIELLGSGV